MNIVFTTDDTYAMHAAVAVASIAKQHPAEPYRIFYVHDEVSRSIVGASTDSSVPSGSIEWIAATVDTTRRSQHPLPPASLAGSRSRSSCPTMWTTVLYLDADVLVATSLTELASVELGDGLVGAVRDIGFPFVGMTLPWRELGLSPRGPYFNCRRALDSRHSLAREDAVGPRAIELISPVVACMFDDQGVLNTLLADHGPPWTRSGTCNRAPPPGTDSPAWIVEDTATLEAALANPAIVHFHTGADDLPNRPWLPGCTNPYTAEWFDMLDTTPWAGWRPKATAHRRRHVPNTSAPRRKRSSADETRSTVPT